MLWDLSLRSHAVGEGRTAIMARAHPFSSGSLYEFGQMLDMLLLKEPDQRLCFFVIR